MLWTFDWLSSLKWCQGVLRSELAATGHVRGPAGVLEAGIGGVSASAELRQEEGPLGCCEAPLEDVVLVLCTIAHRRDAGGARGLRLQRA